MESDLKAIIAACKSGKLVAVLDDTTREDEADLIIPTECATKEHVAFMMRHAKGLVCLSISEAIAKKLDLAFQVQNNNSKFQTPFTVSVDHMSVKESGVTADSRLWTMQRLIAPDASPSEFLTPGHVFPLVAKPSGVLARNGHTEAAYDLARLSGYQPSGIICELLDADGTLLRGVKLAEFLEEHGILSTSVKAIKEYRISNDVNVRELSKESAYVHGHRCLVSAFADDVSGKEHLALVFGDISGKNTPLVRIHSECLTGDVFGSRRCDCGLQLHKALELITAEGSGILLYLRQEGRGIGLGKKLEAYALQDKGFDTVDANIHLGFAPDERDFRVAAHILKALKVSSLRLITNNPRKFETLRECGLNVTERVPVVVPEDPMMADYLKAKREKLGHWV